MKCKKILRSGLHCQANHMKASLFCFRHAPETRRARVIASSKGGQNRALRGFYGTEIRLNSPSDIRKFIGLVINGVWTGQVPVSVGSSMGFLTRCWLEAYEASDLQNRLKDIEDKLKNTNL